MTIPQPATVQVRVGSGARSGAMEGATGRYEKRFSDLRGLFLDEDALERRIRDGL